MKQEALFRKLGNILAELNEQYEFLSQNPNQLTEVELELFLANASFLVEHIQIVKKLSPNVLKPISINKVSASQILPTPLEITNDEVIQEETTTTKEELLNDTTPIESVELEFLQEEDDFQESVDEERVNNFENLINKESFEFDKFDFEDKPADQLFDRQLSEEEERIIANKKKSVEQVYQNDTQHEEDEEGPEPFLLVDVKLDEIQVVNENNLQNSKVQAIIEQPKANDVEEVIVPQTLNEKLANSQQVQSNINETTSIYISDLKSAINLNDKLLFIKDLFNGYNLAYAEVIEIVNKMPNFDTADQYLQKNYAAKNNWSEKQNTVDKFYLLLNRRFKD